MIQDHDLKITWILCGGMIINIMWSRLKLHWFSQFIINNVLIMILDFFIWIILRFDVTPRYDNNHSSWQIIRRLSSRWPIFGVKFVLWPKYCFFLFLVAKIFVLFCFWPKSWPNLDLWQGGGGTPVSAYHIRDQRADGDEYGDDDEDDDVQEEGDDDPCVRPWRHSWPDSEWVAIGEISPIL